MNRRGSMIDVLVLTISLFALIIGLIVALAISNGVNTGIQQTESINETYKAQFQSLDTRMPRIVDGMFLTVYIFLSLGAIVGAWFIDTAKFFMVFSIIILAVIVVISMALSNAYDEVRQQPLLDTYFGELTFIPFIMRNFVIGIMVVAFAVLIALYGKPSGGPFG